MPHRSSIPAARGPDLCACGLLGKLPRRFLDGRDLDLLEPLRFALPGDVDTLTAPAGPALDRGPVAAALRERNERYGHADAARLTEALADPETLVVITGQQCGLGAGPLFTLTKAVGLHALGRGAHAPRPAGGAVVLDGVGGPRFRRGGARLLPDRRARGPSPWAKIPRRCDPSATGRWDRPRRRFWRGSWTRPRATTTGAGSRTAGNTSEPTVASPTLSPGSSCGSWATAARSWSTRSFPRSNRPP